MSENIVQNQHDIIGIVGDTEQSFQSNEDQGTKWFREGGNLGLFVHFGLSTVDADIDLSWAMMANKPWEKQGMKFTITPKEYFSFAEKFQPINYNPEKWIKSAYEAGFTYAVLTTRHHDGFALWPSEYGNFSTKNYFNGTDLVKPFVEACRKYGLKVGLYYSPPDWHYNQEYITFNYGSGTRFKDRPDFDINHKPVKLKTKPENWETDYAKYIRNQVTELLVNYGKIDMLWFDGSIQLYDKTISIEEIREIQPHILVNPRLHKKGDFETHECVFPKDKPTGWWEYCDIWAEGGFWAYSTQAGEYRSAKWALDIFDKAAAWKGNFLLNVGPKSDGELPDIAYQRFNELAQLRKNNTKLKL